MPFCRAFKLLALFGSSHNETDTSANCIDRKYVIKSVLDGMSNRYVPPASRSYPDVASKKVGKMTSSSEISRKSGASVLWKTHRESTEKISPSKNGSH